MTYIFEKWLKYLRNGQSILEMTKDMLERAKVCGKLLKYLRNDLNIWEMTKTFGK